MHYLLLTLGEIFDVTHNFCIKVIDNVLRQTTLTMFCDC